MAASSPRFPAASNSMTTVAATNISGGNGLGCAIGCGPITFPRSPRSGIVVDHRWLIGSLPRRAEPQVFDFNNTPAGAVLIAPAILQGPFAAACRRKSHLDYIMKSKERAG